MQTDNFQRRGPLSKIMERLKTSAFSFIIVNLVNKGGRGRLPQPFVENLKKTALILEKSSLAMVIQG